MTKVELKVKLYNKNRCMEHTIELYKECKSYDRKGWESEYRQTIWCFHLTSILSCDCSNSKLSKCFKCRDTYTYDLSRAPGEKETCQTSFQKLSIETITLLDIIPVIPRSLKTKLTALLKHFAMVFSDIFFVNTILFSF